MTPVAATPASSPSATDFVDNRTIGLLILCTAALTVQSIGAAGPPASHPVGDVLAPRVGSGTVSGVQARAVAAAALLIAGLAVPAKASAAPQECNDPSCVPSITGGVVLGAPCNDTAHFVFGTTSWGRLVFCGSPRRYAPRYFRSPPLQGVRDENSSCEGALNTVAQAPDGLFLSCIAVDGAARWVRGDA